MGLRIDGSQAVQTTIDNRYRNLGRWGLRCQASQVTGATTLIQSGSTWGINNTAGASPQLLYLISTDWAIAGKTSYLRVVASANVTDTAPNASFTIGLYPVSAIAGGTTVTNLTLGTVITGSTIAFTTPAANSMSAVTSSGDFAFPTSGVYILGNAVDGAMQANSNVNFTVSLEARSV